MHLLIPYVRLYGHPDPVFDEWTYGDCDSRARKLRDQVKTGDFLFFHTTLKGRKCITAYFVAERAMNTADVAHDRALVAKYKNPHIQQHADGLIAPDDDDVILFGDPLRSRVPQVPLPFDRRLARKLSIGIRFPRGRLDSQAIGSATRTWRELSNKDVNTILREARKCAVEKPKKRTVLSTEEVSEFLEKDVERCLAAEPHLVGRGLKIAGRQVETDVGRIDLLYEDRKGGKTIVEVKLGNIGNDAVNQLRRYMSWVRRGSRKPVSGILVCKGVLPAFEDEFRHLKNIRILCYGWQPVVYRWGSR